MIWLQLVTSLKFTGLQSKDTEVGRHVLYLIVNVVVTELMKPETWRYKVGGKGTPVHGLLGSSYLERHVTYTGLFQLEDHVLPARYISPHFNPSCENIAVHFWSCVYYSVQ